MIRRIACLGLLTLSVLFAPAAARAQSESCDEVACTDDVPHDTRSRGPGVPRNCWTLSSGKTWCLNHYPAFMGFHYRQPYNYRITFDYPWHACLHPASAHGCGVVKPGLRGGCPPAGACHAPCGGGCAVPAVDEAVTPLPEPTAGRSQPRVRSLQQLSHAELRGRQPAAVASAATEKSALRSAFQPVVDLSVRRVRHLSPAGN